MRFRTTLILLFILAVLGLTFWFWPELESDTVGEVDLLFPTFSRASCERLVLRPPEGDELIIERRDAESGLWEITQPFLAEADDEFVDQVLRDLETSYRFQETGAGSLADYGLETPRLELTFRLAGEEARRIRFGSADLRRQDRPDVFIQIDDDESVYRTQRSLFDALDRQADELRERSVISPRLMNVFDVQRLEVHHEGGLLFAQQVGGQWEIEKPVVAPGDNTVIRSLLSTLLMLQIDRFVADQSADLARFGLAPPRGKVVLASGAGPTASSVTLLIGGDDPERPSNVFVTIAGRGSVYSVIDDQGSLRPNVTAVVSMTADDVRDGRIFGAVRYVSQRIEVQGPGETHWILERPQLDWRVLEPIQRLADTPSVGQLLDRLDLARFAAFLADPGEAGRAELGLADPEITIRLTYGDPPREAIVHLGATDPAGQVVWREDQGTFGRVETAALGFLANGFWPYIERPFWTIRQNDVLELEVRVEGAERSFRRGESGWESDPIPPDAIEAVVRRLVSLAGDEVYERTPEQGLESPIARVKLTTEAGAHVLLIGAPLPRRDEFRFAALESAPEAKAISADFLAELELLVR